MTLERCACCGGPGQVGNPALRLTLCHGCDADFLDWQHTPDTYGCVPLHATDWPRLAKAGA